MRRITKSELRALTDDELHGLVAAVWCEWRLAARSSRQEDSAAQTWRIVVKELERRCRRRLRLAGRLDELGDEFGC